MATSSPSLPPVALIAGATGSGKSALALAVAARVPAVVINADSAQVYRDLRILSARPSDAEEAQAPHRLFGHVDGARACSAAEWAADATRAVDDAHAAGRLPILVGGTGLYLRTLLDGIAPVPEIDADIRAAVRALAVVDAYAALSGEDPAAAARLAPADTTRVARALEVVRSTGRPLADWQRERQGGIAHRIALHPTLLLPPRDWLGARCDARFAAMMGAEGVAEVRALVARRLPAALPVMRAIGVREIAGWLAGDLDRDRALAAGQLSTRRYARRQYTWFQNQPPPGWRRVRDPLDPETLAALAREIGNDAFTPAPLDGARGRP